MILIPSKSTCLIEYESVQNSTDAKDHLNNVKLCGNAIRVLLHRNIKILYIFLIYYINILNLYDI